MHGRSEQVQGATDFLQVRILRLFLVPSELGID